MDTLLSSKQREHLETVASAVTMRQEVRNGVPVLVDEIKRGENAGKEIVFVDYVRIEDENKQDTPVLLNTLIIIVAIVLGIALAYVWMAM